VARLQIPVTKGSPAGVNPAEITPVAADDCYFKNDGRTFLLIRNNGASPTTVTIPTPAKVAGLDVAEQSIVVAAGATHIAGPFPPRAFNQADGTVHVDVTSTDPRFRAVTPG
jgi:hypothetical protein